MKQFLLLPLLLFSALAYSQTPLFYQSNYVRIVQPDFDDPNMKFDTLMNPYTGGMNNPMFFKMDMNGDGLSDLFVFDREVNENQFINFIATNKNSVKYRFTPQYESAFPLLNSWAGFYDFNGDSLPDIFTHSMTNSTGILAYKNASYIDPVTKKYTLSFKKFQDTLFYTTKNYVKKPLDVSYVSNPVFMDIDKDGYMDVLTFDINLTTLQYFRNQGKTRDSLNFYYTDMCWGKFIESGSHLYSPFNGLEYNAYDPKYPKYKTSAIHGYTSLCLVDKDGDGDYDLLLGDGGNDSLAMLENGETTNKHHIDTIINIRNNYVDNNYPVDDPAIISNMPSAYNVDIDNDGIKDLIVAAGEPTDTQTNHGSRLNDIWYYKNYGNATIPIFRIIKKNFLQNTTVDWGVNSAPCFIDVDKDGRKDLLIAVRDGGAKHGYSHLILYLNKPGKNGGKPYFLYKDNDYLGLSSYTAPVKRPIPSPYLNGQDKHVDMVMGNDSGHVIYYKDMSTGTSAADFRLAQWSLMYVNGTGMSPIDVGYNSSPAAADINHDGMTDLLIGANDGRISYYRCLGYGPAPDYIPYFELVTNTFGGINAMPASDYQSAPCVADLDKDGKADLLLGDRYGRLFYYHDFDTVSTLVASSDPLVYDYRTGQRFAGKLFSTYTIPAVANLDQDTMPDIMLGCRRGGLFFLGSDNNGFEDLANTGIKTATVQQVMMNLYPNPAKNYFIIKSSSPVLIRNAELEITDILGRQMTHSIMTLPAGAGQFEVPTENLKNGIYLVSIISEGQLICSQKMIIQK